MLLDRYYCPDLYPWVGAVKVVSEVVDLDGVHKVLRSNLGDLRRTRRRGLIIGLVLV